MEYKFINTEYIETVSGGDRDIIVEITSLFMEQVPQFLSEMQMLYEKKDYFNLGLLAHKAKSSVAIMGMSDLAIMLKKFESEAKVGLNASEYQKYISRFGSDSDKALAEIKAYIESL